MKRICIPALLLLTACNGKVPVTPQPSVNPSPIASVKPSSVLFGNAQNKRSLSLTLFGAGTNQQNAASNDAASGSKNNAPAPSVGMAPTSSGTGGGSMARPGMAAPPQLGSPEGISARAGMVADSKMSMPYWGGGEFNNYVLQFAEENEFPASKDKTLLNAYNNTVKPFVNEWDSSARLLESQAYLGGSKGDMGMYYLPNSQGEPEQVKVNYIFRFASSSRKETLVIYLTASETRVHRLVWGEANVDLSKVQIDTDEAIEITRKAITSRLKSPGYPVYPDQSYPGMEILFEAPATAHWTASLSQNNGASRYYVSVNFEKSVPNQKEKQMVYGSAEVDSESGKILSLNRPVLYNQQDVVMVEPPMMAQTPGSLADPQVLESTSDQNSDSAN